MRAYIRKLPARLVLVGLGLHAKRFHLPFLRKHNILPILIVDLAINRDEVLNYIAENHLQAETLFLSAAYRDSDTLESAFSLQLMDLCKKHKINRAIVATEPKAHRAFASFFLAKGIDTLIDKPITSPIGAATDLTQAKKVFTDYEELATLSKKGSNGNLSVLVQRRFHPGYAFIYDLVEGVVQQYNVPITFLDVYHAEGMWTMPPEFESRENHPHKYGYGKLMHSGYHMVDIAAWFMMLNERLTNKRPNYADVTSYIIDPADFQQILTHTDYQNLLGKGVFKEYFRKPTKNLDTYGEIDISASIRYRRDNSTIALCSLNLLQNGFTRRSWSELPLDDMSLKNGRVRHERFTIQVGPLLSVQVSANQSYEGRDKVLHANELFDEGNFEHFDITIYRNVDLIGGKPYEKRPISELCNGSALGHQDIGNEACLLAFLKGESHNSRIELHRQTNLLISHLYQSIVNDRQGRAPQSSYVL